ncbi:MAG: pyridoxamine 5'-phosphate oxidase family protein [Candidatus Omnitrophica bacterium]|nr:pyridoxamine 5'-phosphate oxidase family protein [Candidatus Omnitrophota bacterium]
MKTIPSEIINFLTNQGFVVLSTVDNQGFPHSSCKGIIKIEEKGKIFLLDLYHGKTYENLKINPYVSVTVVDEHKFKGYSLKGKGEIVKITNANKKLLKNWEDLISRRLVRRLLKNIKGEKGHSAHPEAHLPSPKYLIEIKVEEIVDLKPAHIK